MTQDETIDGDSEARESAPAAPPAVPPARDRERDAHYALAPPRERESPQARMPFLAAFFSVFPGLGNVYNGLYMRGVAFFLVCFGFIALAGEARVEERVLLVFSAIFVWFFNIFDAYRQATLINYGYSPNDELAVKPRISAWGSGGLVFGVVVFAIGLLGLLHEYFDIDLSRVLDHWYVLFMAIGAYMIAKTVLDRRRSADSGEAPDGDLEGI